MQSEISGSKKSRGLRRLKRGNLALSGAGAAAALGMGYICLRSGPGAFQVFYGIAALVFAGAPLMGALLHRRLRRYEDLISAPEPSTVRQVEEFSFGGVVVRGGKVSSVDIRSAGHS